MCQSFMRGGRSESEHIRGSGMSSIGTARDHVSPPGLVSDCRLMLRYALKDAFELPVELIEQIAQLDVLLKQSGFAPISDIDERLVFGDRSLAVDALAGRLFPERVGSGCSPPDSYDAVARILMVHAGLSKVIAPASALTLQASEPPTGKHRFFGGMPLIVKAAALASFVSALLFVVTADLIADGTSSGNDAPPVERATLAVPQRSVHANVNGPTQQMENTQSNSGYSSSVGTRQR